MTMHSFALTPGRINKFKGSLLKHAVPMEILGKTGRHVSFPKNNSDTYVARRFLPYGTASTNSSTLNQFFAAGNGNRDAAIVQAHVTQEGVTPTPENITPQDVTVVMQQYSCLYGFTDKTADLYEDDIPGNMVQIAGERVSLVNEMIIYGGLRAGTNQYFGGTGTTVATTNGGLTLGLLRKIAKNLQANHGRPVNSVLKASAMYGTSAVAPGFSVYCHTDLTPDIFDLPNFTPAEEYASGTPQPNEVGKCEMFRFFTSPDLPSVQNGGAAVGATNLYSTTGSNIDVYTLIVTAQDAWSHVAVRGMESLNPTFIPTGTKTGTDPFGQRGYVGTMWWKSMMIENNGWMAVASVGAKNLV